MARIAGIVNTRQNILGKQDVVRDMLEKIAHKHGANRNISFDEHSILGAASTLEGEDPQPVSCFVGSSELILVLDGEFYNADEIKKELECKGHKFETDSNTEILLKAYAEWGAGCLAKLNGIYSFAVWNKADEELFMARDRFGIKPLYYTVSDDALTFSSEIKGLFECPDINPVIDIDGISEILALGPAHTPGNAVFKDIYELKPGCLATFTKDGFSEHKYYEPENKDHEDDLETTTQKLKELITTAIDRELDDKENTAFFLSGGIDSSTIVALGAKKFGKIKTYSIRYEGNSEHFKPSFYQPDSDEKYIEIMNKNFDLDHEIIEVSTQNLLDYLEKSVLARDLPGMADVDSSLYYVCETIGENYPIVMSGEGADEVLLGYPWLSTDEYVDCEMFPWEKNVEFRSGLLPETFCKEVDVSNYIKNKYSESIEGFSKFNHDSDTDRKRRNLHDLNFNWFGGSLIQRSETIGMDNSLVIRMPYVDYELVEYARNIPWKFMSLNDREKGLFREAMKDIVPEEIRLRKKSPYPKTHNPEFDKLIRCEVEKILADENASVWNMVNREFIKSQLKEDSDLSKPVFGQLMALPQMFGYVYQIEKWLEDYDIKIEL